MATRGTIALEFADGTVQQIYSHWDNYLSHNGKILQEHYSDPFKLQRLLDLGGISSLDKEIGIQHNFNDRLEGVTTFYTRDRGESLTIEKFASFADYVENHQYEEYEYILRQVDGKAVWFVDFEEGYVTLAEAFEQEKEAA